MEEERRRWSSNDNVCWPRSYSSRGYDRFVSYDRPLTRSSVKGSIWTQLWRKFKKDKKRMFHCSKSMRFNYDPHSYSQNFDQGSVCADPDDLCRSFSARFAVPSRIFEHHRSSLIIT